MSDPTVGFFNPSDIVGLEGWEVQSDNETMAQDRAQGLDKHGDEEKSQLHNKRITRQIVLKCFATTGNLSLPKGGLVLESGDHLDGWALAKVPTDWPTLTLNLHKHDNGTSHEEGSCRTYTPSLTVAAGFGVERTPGGFALGIGDTAIGMAGFTYSLQVTHQDELDGVGNWLAGENRDGAESVEIQLTGKGATITPIAGWDKPGAGDARSNTAAETDSASYVHHLKFDAPAE